MTNDVTGYREMRMCVIFDAIHSTAAETYEIHRMWQSNSWRWELPDVTNQVLYRLLFHITSSVS